MNFSHAAFAPYRPLMDESLPQQGTDSLNTLAARHGIRHDNGSTLRFVPANRAGSAADYEQSINRTAHIPTREDNLHDFLNALVWLRFPRLKSALNLRHCQMLEHAQERRQRGRLRDQLTLLDESGVLVASPRRDLLDLLRDKRWVELFWQGRDDVAKHMTFIVVGHGLLEKCARPFSGMTGKCLIMETDETRPQELDRLAAKRVNNASALSLPPLPILGIPDWDNNDSLRYYQNTDVFRPKRADQGRMSQTHS
jgi:hypothetical protein